MKSTKGVLCFVVLLGLVFVGPATWGVWVEDGNPVCPSVSGQDRPEIVKTSEGEWIVVWRDDRAGLDSNDVYAQGLSSVGDPLWATDGIPVCTAWLGQERHQVVADCCGGAIVAWEDYRAGYDDVNIYVQRISSSGDVLWTTDGVAVCTATGHQQGVSLSSDGYGGAFLTWQDTRSGGADIYAQYISALGDPQWTPDGVVVCSADTSQLAPTIVTGASGEPVIIWVDVRNGNKDIYAQGLSLAGVPQWTADGEVVCAATGDQITPQIVPGQFYFAAFVVVWSDLRGATWDIYAQRISPAGSMEWTPDGVPVCLAANRQDAPKVVASPFEATIAWSDDRSGEYDIYAQRLNEAGAALWTADGIGVCTAPGHQAAPGLDVLDMVSDGTGGAIIAWWDPRDGIAGDIYAQRLNGDGTTEWLPGGLGVCLAPGPQSGSVLAPDGTGGAVVAWLDGRAVPGNIYAQRVIGSGQLGSAEADILVVADVPNDQGGKIQVQWHASALDFMPGGEIVYYSLWRGVPLASPSPQLAGMEVGAMPPMRADFDGKAVRRVSEDLAAEWIANIPARAFTDYAYTVVSLYDSMGTDPGWQYFMVSAHTADQYVFYDSPIDSGYSVDNLSPLPPAALVAQQSQVPEGLEMSWDENGEDDFHHYAVYRGTSSGFVPNPGNRIGTPIDAQFFDGDWRWDSGYWYKIAAVDVHGNASSYATLGPGDVTDIDPTRTPRSNYLAQNHPNPFGPTTRIAFGLNAPGSVSLQIYDAAGRLVRVLATENLGAGDYSKVWDGRDMHGVKVASGVYFYRLEAGSFSQTRKMVLLR